MPNTHTEIKDRYLPKIISLIRKYLQDEALIILFGSRARKEQRPFSDYDICIKSNTKLGVKKFLIEEALEESTIPYKVDLIDYFEAGQELRARIDREGLVC